MDKNINEAETWPKRRHTVRAYIPQMYETGSVATAALLIQKQILPVFLRVSLKSGLTCFAIADRTCRGVIAADTGVHSSQLSVRGIGPETWTQLSQSLFACTQKLGCGRAHAG